MLTVTGTGFEDECLLRPDGTPREVRLFVEQGGTRVSVARVRVVDADWEFEVRFGVPQSLTPGPARLIATTSETAGGVTLAATRFRVANG